MGNCGLAGRGERWIRLSSQRFSGAHIQELDGKGKRTFWPLGLVLGAAVGSGRERDGHQWGVFTLMGKEKSMGSVLTTPRLSPGAAM